MQRATILRKSVWFGLLALSACAPEFDTTRQIPDRGSLGQELFGIVCDRVGAQALREDVTGASFHGVCHPDELGNFAETVDVSKLPPLSRTANVAGELVPIEDQEARRLVHVARVEALGRRRADFVQAIDALLPDVPVDVRDLGALDGRDSCDAAGKQGNLKTLADTFSRFLDLYHDGTVPQVTEAVGYLMDQASKDKDVPAALARIDGRRGYRPAELGLGLVRPLLQYPRLTDLANSALKLIAADSDPVGPESEGVADANRDRTPGKAHVQFQKLLEIAYHELRTAKSDPPTAALTSVADPLLAPRTVLSRPRTTLELSQHLLLQTDEIYGSGDPRFIVRRDPRAMASVTLVGGKIPAPFVDLTGASGKPDGLPDVDNLGQFLTATPVPSPFFAYGSTDGKRDIHGRATYGDATPIYGSLDTGRTYASALLRDVRGLIEPDATKGREALMYFIGGLPLLLGDRTATPKNAIYPGDSTLPEVWARHIKETPPDGLGKAEVKVPFRPYDPSSSPLVDLVHGLGQIMATQEVDETLGLFAKLLEEHPTDVARFLGLTLELKAIGDRHPEAKLRESSTFWDEMLDVVAKMAQKPGVLEDLFKAFGDDRTLKLDKIFQAYLRNRDELTYDRKNLNGPAYNLTTSSVSGLGTPVDRSKPDVGENRSALQRFMQLLHDANGLAACTKEGAIAHVNIKWLGLPVALDYPNNVLTKAVCAFLGAPTPSRIPQCGILRFENVAALLLDVALRRAKFDVRDKCLAKLMDSPLTGLVGGANAFLEETSGIKGFSLDPTVNGVGRMVFFDAAHDGLAGDTANAKTNKFLNGVLDPVPSTVCPEAPFTDPSDGKILKLRKCASFSDTLRGRDNNAIFPIEQLGFIDAVAPLAASFADHDASLLFVELFDTMHLHWGSSAQPKEVCDPSAPRTDARWCAQDGLVSYEPLIDEMLNTELFPVLHDFVNLLKATKVPRCTTWGADGVCAKSVQVDGITVLSDALRVMVDPKRNDGLTNRRGRKEGVRNDGSPTPQVTPIYLFLDGLKGMDAAFAKAAAAPGKDGEDNKVRSANWKKARSQIVDQLFTITGKGTASTFQNLSIQKILPVILQTLRAQISAHCPDHAGRCTWAKDEITKSLSDWMGGPAFASTLDLVDILRADPEVRSELQKLLVYLLDAAAIGSPRWTTLAAATDFLQILDDDVNLSPLYRMASRATAPDFVVDGKTVERGLLPASVEAITRILARARDRDGTRICAREIDPNASIDGMLKRLVEPMPKNGNQTPLEVLSSIAADVNRADPNKTDKLTGADYVNIGKEVADFCLDPARGLEQVYEVIRQATKPTK